MFRGLACPIARSFRQLQNAIIRMQPAKAVSGFLVEKIAVDRRRFEAGNAGVERFSFRFESLQFRIERSDFGFKAPVRPQPAFAVNAVIAEIADQDGDQHP